MRFYNGMWWSCESCGASTLEREQPPLQKPRPMTKLELACGLWVALMALAILCSLLLSGCAASPDSFCAQECVAKGRDDGCFNDFTCVCLVVHDGGQYEECDDVE